jgi:hypothetical protein
VNRVDHFFQAVLVVLTVRRILVGGFEHEIDGGVEVAARAGNIVRLVEPFTVLKRLLGAQH